MGDMQFVLFWLALALYTLAWAGSLAGVIFHKDFFQKASIWLSVTGLLAHGVSLAVRSLAINHLPLFGTYENSQVAGWVIVLFTVIVCKSYARFRYCGAATLLWAMALVLWSLKFNKNMIPLTISEQSLWVDFHVLFAWMAFGSFFVAWALALGFLLPRRLSFLKAPDEIDELQFKFLTFGFTTYTVMLSLGAIYSYLLFGKWWQWDIVETISLITWLLYGLIIHIRLFYPRRGTLAAVLIMLAPIGILVSYLGLSFLGVPTYHNFDLPF
ncbi:MAG: cytochrome c biogenesis protein [Eubacteriales bacterium]